jgi:hypothetical protein
MSNRDRQTDGLLDFMEEYLRRAKSGGSDPLQAAPLGIGNTLTWSEYQRQRQMGRLKEVRVRTKETSLTVDTDSLMYGCGGLFGLCGPDDILGLTMQDDPLVSWLGFYPDTFCEKSVKAWIYTDVDGTAAGSPTGYVYGDACEDPPISEKGVCEYYIGDFGTLRGCGEPVHVNSLGLRKCDKQPVYTVPIEGVGPVRIDNDLDLESINAAQLVKHELSRLLVTGDKNTNGQFDGLSQLVKTGYVSVQGERCYAMDSWVTDWENDDLSGAVNGHGSIISKVRDMVRRIMWRISQAGVGKPAEGDMVLLMPSWAAWQFLDEWAWWSIRTGQQYNEVFRDVYAMRDFRDRHAMGMFGGGYITIDGFNIHILHHDWAPITQDAPNFCFDIYLLTRALGGRRIFQGQYMPSDIGADAVADVAGYRYFNVESFQGGRALRWVKYDNACVEPCLLFRPRYYLEAPWSQGKIENVCVSVQFDPESLDPQSSYFIEDNQVAASQVTQYWYSDEGWFQ